ncbi:hypothetical protein MUN78_07040 [Leucobacter allii]|uniref:Zinc-ribbon domain-containing protein n=1 Tax=Leucobacter allii TaxID=2932247 RepID=A0ABY4FQN7_9MICO|nr:hypothetical protein [Leucobacter allii]UOQ58572.1 hypothetical protein MUN78_07040 [Leucobacter allii]
MTDETLPPPLFDLDDFDPAPSPLRLLGAPTAFPTLPSRWDGDVVRWDDWQELPLSSVEFHGKSYQCAACGTAARPYTSLGRRQPGTGEVFEVIRRHKTIRSRWGKSYRIPVYDHATAWPVIQWIATRCGWCGLTEVVDLDSDETWILDDTDYGPDGSRRPEDTPHPAALALEDLTP